MHGESKGEHIKTHHIHIEKKHDKLEFCKEKELHDAWRRTHYAQSDINNKLIINLRDLSHTMRFLSEGKGSQKRILIILSEENRKMTQSELTNRLGIQPGSASEIIAKLESAGYIKRTPNQTDRRTLDIELTTEGFKAAKNAINERMERHKEMFSCLSDEEKNNLLLLLEKLSSDWEKRYPGSDGPPPHGRHHRHMHETEG